mgnify:CR=1 FL=1
MGLAALICLAATTHACSSLIGGVTPSPCHFSIVAMGKRAIVAMAAGEKPPPGPSCWLLWKKAGHVAIFLARLEHPEHLQREAALH